MLRWRVSFLIQSLIQVGLVPLTSKGFETIGGCFIKPSRNKFGERLPLFLILLCFSSLMVEAIMALLPQYGSLNICIFLLHQSLIVVFMQYLLILSGLSFSGGREFHPYLYGFLGNGISKYATEVMDKIKEKGTLKICFVSLFLLLYETK